MNSDSQSATSRSSRRSRQSTSNGYELDCSFQPYPPIKDQEKNLRSLCQKIIKSLPEISNDENQIDDSIAKFVDLASDFQNALQKLLGDLIKQFTSIFRRKTQSYDEIKRTFQSINRCIEETLVNGIFDAFRKKQESIVLTYLGQLGFLNLLVEYWGFVEDSAIILINHVWTYCSEVDHYISEDFDGRDNYDSLYSIASSLFVYILKKHYEILGELQLKFINGVKQIDQAKSYTPEEEEEEDLDENIMGDKEEKQLREKIGNAIRRSFMLIYPNIQEYWDNEFYAKLDELLERQNQGNELEEEEDDEYEGIILNIDIYDLFDSRLQQIETLYQLARRVNGDDQKRLKKFILNEASLSFDNQIECLKQLWLHAHQATGDIRYCEGEMAHIGHKIFENLRVQSNHYNDLQFKPPETLTRVCEIFKISEEIQDTNTSDQMLPLVFSEIQDQLEVLDSEHKSELDNFKTPPETKYITIFQKTSKKLNKVINSLALSLAESIKLVDTAFFYHSKVDPNIILTELTEEIKNVDVFQSKGICEQFVALKSMSAVLEKTIVTHIKQLKQLLNAAYNSLYMDDPMNRSSAQSTAFSSISNQTGRSDSLKKQDKRLINDRLSLCSRTSKNVALKAKTSKPPEKKAEYRALLECILESLGRSYEVLFAVYRNMIIQATRFTSSEDTPIGINEKLNNRFTEYLSYLDILKKWYTEEMNIDKVQTIEKRMDVCHNLSQNIINECLEESFCDCIHKTVLKYLQECELIDDFYNSEFEKLEDTLLKKLGIIRDERHTKELQIIELQYRIALVNEKKRTSKAQSEIEDRVRSLLAAKQYDQAKREQEKIAKVKRDEWKLRKKQVDDKYKKIREQKLEQQAGSIKALEDWYENKKLILNQQWQHDLDSSLNALKPAQLQIIQQHLNLANLMKKGTNVKKAEEQLKKTTNSPMKKDTLTRRYTELANKILTSYNIDV